MAVQEFPVSVIEKLGYYVYFLIAPDTEQIFYIGKGTGNRVFAHANAALADASPNEKLDTIRAIHSAGQSVKHVIHRHGLTEKEAFEVEAALIEFVGLDKLTNQVHGYNSDDQGQMSAQDIISKYAAPDVIIAEPVILITVNRLYHHGMSADALYEITRGNWVIGPDRAKARYAFTVYHGLIREVYAIDRWFAVPAPYSETKQQTRWRFEGHIAPELQHYIGGSTARYAVVGAQNPIRYVNIKAQKVKVDPL